MAYFVPATAGWWAVVHNESMPVAFWEVFAPRKPGESPVVDGYVLDRRGSSNGVVLASSLPGFSGYVYVVTK